MERTLFDSDGYDFVDAVAFVFHNCTLKVPVGEHPIGTKFEFINLSYDEGVLELPNGDVYQLILSIGEKKDEENQVD